MSEPDNFLSRWSRRKAAATEKDVAPAATPEADAKTDANADQIESGAPAPQDVTPPPEFDPATLPPIESITSVTDISAFLRAGVPADLTRAALRRAWAADPAIRDFIGLSENSWDFTAPNGVPGFGPLSAEDASRLMAQFTSSVKDVAEKAKEAVERISQLEPSKEPAQATLSSGEINRPPRENESASKEISSPAQEEPGQNPAANADATNSSQRSTNDIATQHNRAQSNDSHPTRRAHGSALPE